MVLEVLKPTLAPLQVLKHGVVIRPMLSWHLLPRVVVLSVFVQMYAADCKRCLQTYAVDKPPPNRPVLWRGSLLGTVDSCGLSSSDVSRAILRKPLRDPRPSLCHPSGPVYITVHFNVL